MGTKTRITIEYGRFGQPRAYADSVSEAWVLFENVPWNSKTGEFEPWVVTTVGGLPIGPDNVPSTLKAHVPALNTPPKSAQKYGLEPYLAAFGPSSDKGPGWYRYLVISPFTD